MAISYRYDGPAGDAFGLSLQGFTVRKGERFASTRHPFSDAGDSHLSGATEDTMKRTAIALVITCLFFGPPCLRAGETADADKAAIEQTALDYVDGFYAGSAERLDKALHPNLQKVTLRQLPNGRDMLDFNGAAYNLKEYAASGLAQKPAAERKIKVTVLEVYQNIATVKIDSADFLDYAHVAKINGEWKIINVLWTMHPKTPEGENPGK